MGVCVKLAAVRHSAAEIVFWRSSVSLLLMIAAVAWRGVDLRTPYLRLQVFRGATGFISLALYFIAIVWLPLATAVTLNYTSPLFLALFLALFGGMRFRASLVAALFLGLLGVAILLRPVIRADQIVGGMAAVGSGCMAGLAYFNVRALGGRGEPESRTVFYFSLVSTILAGVWMVFDAFHPIDLQYGTLLVAVAAFATLAQLAMTRAYKSGNTLVSASLAYATVVFASLFGVVLWGDAMSWRGLVGIGLIVVSGVATIYLSRDRGSARNSLPGEPVLHSVSRHGDPQGGFGEERDSHDRHRS